MKHLTCEFCETITEKKPTVLEATRKNKTFTMMMDAEVCPNCKEEYYDGQKLIQFEKAIQKQNDHIKTTVKDSNKNY